MQVFIMFLKLVQQAIFCGRGGTARLPASFGPSRQTVNQFQQDRQPLDWFWEVDRWTAKIF